MSQTITLHLGDCRVFLESIDPESVGAFIGDPPYDLTTVDSKSNKKSKTGFMGKKWDATGIAFDPEFWKLVYRVLKIGGIVRVFGATRTFHRMCKAIEVAGFTGIRLNPCWVYGCGMPAATDISKNIDIVLGVKRKVIGTKKGVGGENLNDIKRGAKVIRDTSRPGARGIGAYGTGAKQVVVDVDVTAPGSPEALKYKGVSTALKPSWEPVVEAVKSR